MLKFLAKLLGSSKPDPPAPEPQKATRAPTGPTQAEIRPASSPRIPRETEDALERLWLEIAHLSNPEYRFLHPTYSPNSRVPCADFTPFLVDRIRNHDEDSIRRLMRAVIAANPGLGIGPQWIDESVREILKIDFSHYCHSAHSAFFPELQALFILGAKDGGGREFWLADETLQLFAYCLCCHNIEWGEGMKELWERANRFIRRMRKDTPFWQGYPLFEETTIEHASVNNLPIVSELCNLPLLARLHLVAFVEGGGTSLMHSSTYKMRSLGLNPAQTAPILCASGICAPTCDQAALAGVLSKNDLMVLLEQRAIAYKKSWKKAQLLETLAAHAPDLLEQAAERERVVCIKDGCLEQLRSLIAYAKSLEDPLKLLCFATPTT
jgi:hypothetical protein